MGAMLVKSCQFIIGKVCGFLDPGYDVKSHDMTQVANEIP